jgi:8-oxo-dGTP pyrophosphatase MutT (NUDIX family)
MIRACGGLIISKNTQRGLFLLRSGHSYPNTWGLVGGKVDRGESIPEALCREIKEEIGFLPKFLKIFPVELFTSQDQNFEFSTFVCVVKNEFLPILNNEHHGFTWCSIDHAPKPVHPGLFKSFNSEDFQEKILTIVSSISELDSFGFTY